MAGGVAQLWKEWEIQILVLLSFTLQVILLGLARIRRRKGSDVLRILLWLAYLGADSTAIYTLGHLSLRTRTSSNSSTSSEKCLMAFWAPFLLLHLGGPDTITAYALEDNELWLRHLLTLAVQVLGAVYVLSQLYAGCPGRRLVVASVLMFVTGFVKYGEKTWALKCASMGSIRSSLDLGDFEGRRRPYDGRRTRRRPARAPPAELELDEEEVLLGAHYTFNVCKSLFTDNLMTSGPEQDAMDQGVELNGRNYMYELIEMHLSLMYDILYTKAAVIHTWHGWCIRVVSPAATLAAFLLFQLDRSSSSKAYSSSRSASADGVVVTYVLLLGALVVETTSLLRAVGSSWTCAFLHARRQDRLHGALVWVRRRFRAASRRRWLRSMGQYSLLGFCTHDTADLGSRIAKKVGLEERWSRLHYSSTTQVSPGARDLVLQVIMSKRQLGDLRNARGKWALQQIKGLYDEISWSIDEADMDQSILIWHVATHVYLCCRDNEPPAAAAAAADLLAETVKEVSDYMMFLYVAQPHMLPGPVRGSRYENNCHGLVTLWRQHSPALQAESDDYGARTPREHLARLLHRLYGDDPSTASSGRSSHADSDSDSGSIQVQDNNPHGLAYIDGAALAGMLLAIDRPDVLQVIAEVWIEMLCYAARHCSEVAHSKQLSNGGELVTAIGLLVEYTGRANFHRQGLAVPNGTKPPGRSRTSTANSDASTSPADISMARRGQASTSTAEISQVSVDLDVC